MRKLLFVAFFLSTCLSVSGADSFSPLEERMSAKEFKDTGLSRLTDEELEALNEWVRSHPVATPENVAVSPKTVGTVSPKTAGAVSPKTAGAVQGDATTVDSRGLIKKTKDETEEDKTIKSSIVGDFDGWSGDAVFKLANGMIWKQKEDARFYTNTVQNPEVTITKGFMGNWLLSVDGHNSTVRVKRIQ